MLRSSQLLKLSSLIPKNLRVPSVGLAANLALQQTFAPRRFFSTEDSASGQKAFVEPPELNFQKEQVQNLEFKAETKRLLEIVAKSLYQDKEVFLRELLSNAADALEKQRYMQMSGKDVKPGDPLQVAVVVSEAKKQIIIQDTGIGMSKNELIDNLGTIASSGSRKFLEQVTKDSSNISMNDKIIGQFGVGFYSSFIVGDSVQVVSKSSQDSQAYLWVSDGSGKYEVSTVGDPGFSRGTKIIIHLRPDCLLFSKFDEVKKIIQKYSNFIEFPIFLNGEKMNLIGALWARDKKEISSEEYKQFWEYISNSQLPYKYKLHYSTDAPLSIKSLIYIPTTHSEKYGLHAEENEVSLYSRKILIKSKCKEIIPNWLRFLKGVVDCEDIPLNISRENYQDSALIAKLRGIITKRIVKTLDEEARKDEEGYLAWYKDFQYFIKEGMASDQENTDLIMPLVRYQANFSDKFVTIEDYVAKLKPDSNKIYFLLAPNKEAAMNSPYMEPFKNTDIPVLFIYMHLDEMVFRSVQEYKKKYKFVNIESSFEELSKDIKPQEPAANAADALPEDEVTPYCLWIKNELQPVVNKVQISKRLKDSPAIIVGQMSSGMRQVMSMLDKENSQQVEKNLTLEINPSHEIIVKLNKMRKNDSNLASVVVRQLLDNTMLTAGMITDPKNFITRVNKLITHILNNPLGGRFEDAQSTTVEAMREEASKMQESVLRKLSEEADKQKKEEKPAFDAEIVIDKDGNPQVKK